MLTIQEIKKAKAGDKPRKLYDRDGLYLFVTPTGGKLWRGKCRVNGKAKTLSLGPYPKVSLAEARARWSAARELDDPSAAKRAEKQAADSSTPTFLAVAKEWHTRQTPGWARKHASQVWRSLEIDILPTLGHRPIDEIQPREIMALIENIEDRGAGEIATRVLQRARAMRTSSAPRLRTRRRNRSPYILSRSRSKNRGAVSKGNASTICCTVHWAVGCSVTLKWTIWRRSCRSTRNPYSIRKVAVGAVKKAMDTSSLT